MTRSRWVVWAACVGMAVSCGDGSSGDVTVTDPTKAGFVKIEIVGSTMFAQKFTDGEFVAGKGTERTVRCEYVHPKGTDVSDPTLVNQEGRGNAEFGVCFGTADECGGDTRAAWPVGVQVVGYRGPGSYASEVDLANEAGRATFNGRDVAALPRGPFPLLSAWVGESMSMDGKRLVGPVDTCSWEIGSATLTKERIREAGTWRGTGVVEGRFACEGGGQSWTGSFRCGEISLIALAVGG